MELISTKDLALKVQEMRKAQRDYFKTPGNEYIAKRACLETSKRLEREVDALCKTVLDPAPANQPSLFNDQP